jgi:L-threonylcarbamoyladenylate synthase
MAPPAGPLLSVGEAVECLKRAEVIAYPTEAVYGLGCDPRSETAVREILRLKGRSEEAGLILIADRFDRFLPFVEAPGKILLDRAFATWPGPVTWLFPRAPDVPDWLAGAHTTVALRVTAHPVCRELCAIFGSAVVSTSANPSSEPPARSAGRVVQYFGDALGGVVEGNLGSDPRPTQIRDLASGRVIRAG